MFNITLCVGLTLTLNACGKKGGPHAMPPMSVTIGTAIKMDTPIVINTFGNTEDKISVDVVPQVSGMLVKNLIKDGDTVTAGQPLFIIDTCDYAARVKQVEGMVNADKANFELARVTMERNKPLLDKNLISQENFDTIKTKASAIEAQLQMDSALLEQANINLSRCTITSTVAGVCSKIYVDEGNLVAAGMTRLTNIRSYDPIRVAFSVSDQYLPAIRQSMAEGKVKIEVTPRGSANSYAGTLEFVDNAVNPATGTILLRGEVPNPDLKLWANQFVDVRIIAGIITNAVMIPESAVQFGKLGPYLFAVTKENKADLRQIKIGVRYNNLLQVIEGVSADEQIVALGQFMLYPGATVMDLSKMPPAGAAPGAPAGTAPDSKTANPKESSQTPENKNE